MRQNPTATYKALLLDYDALLTYSDAECEFCLSEREIQMLLALVDYIGWKTRYKPTETEIDTNLIDRWSANLARKLMDGCCGDNGIQHRFTEAGVWQTSQDGGATWYDDPISDPRNNVSYFPPLAGSDGTEKRCEGATNAFEFLKQTLIDELATGLAYAEVFDLIVGILGVLGVLGVGIIAAIIAGAIFVAGVIVVQAAFTAEVWTDFKCILYCNIGNDASYSASQWEQVKAGINGKFTGAVNVILWNWVNALGHIGLTNAARSNMGLGADCTACECGCGEGCTFDWGADIYRPKTSPFGTWAFSGADCDISAYRCVLAGEYAELSALGSMCVSGFRYNVARIGGATINILVNGTDVHVDSLTGISTVGNPAIQRVFSFPEPVEISTIRFTCIGGTQIYLDSVQFSECTIA